ncbi:MAG: putative Ig domain-containing protein [Candidatus Accumulibacter sp.]|uniref:Ig domain-containing protein n=1 Tax=Candidatus Accumulibacter proximus TaxID=2954385 RepID=A0A935PUN1_9PROT|nr:putative Ig domain-containing protein [Candidatus Accumulibacter proximus]
MVNVAAEYDAAGNQIAAYTYGLGLERQSSAANGSSYYDFDAIGSTAGLTNGNGAYVDQYRYLPFGENLTTTETVANPFEYVGQWGVMGEGNGLNFMRARFYNALDGRFTQIDPLGLNGGDTNLYRYVNNEPANIIDPSGQLFFIPFAAAVVVTGVGVALNFLTAAPMYVALRAQTEGRDKILLGNLEDANSNKLHLLPQLNQNLNTAAQFTVLGEQITSGYKTVKSTPKDIGHVLSGSYNSTNLGDFGNNLRSFFKKAFDPSLSDYLADRADRFWNFVNKTMRVIGAIDPNDILGPDGYGNQHWVTAKEALPYTVRFENLATATAPAQQVTVTLPLDSDVDVNSFRLGDFGWGELDIHVPDGVAFYMNRIDLTASKGYLVDVVAGIDVQSHEVFWTLTAIDPNTGEIPDNPTVGFLPPNDADGAGEGYVNFTVKPGKSAGTGAVIDAKATIVFDINEPIDTPAIFNTVDSRLPSSQMDAAGASGTPATRTVNTTQFEVHWSGNDTGSGLAGYTVYVSDNGGAYAPWLENTTRTHAAYLGQPGHTYAFYTLSRDNAGNVEAAPGEADLVVRVAALTGNNAPVVANRIADQAANASSVFRFALAPDTFTDMDAGDRLSYAAALTDDSALPTWLHFDAATATFSGTPVSGDVGSLDVRVTATDMSGAAVSDTFVVTVSKAAPTLALSGVAATNEGAAYTLHIVGNVGGGAADRLSCDIDWGDGSTQNLTAAQLATLLDNVTHTYTDDEDGPVNATHRTIRVTVSDEDGGSSLQNKVVTVNNVAPTASISGADSVNEAATYTLNVGAINDPGTDTRSSYAIHWGDGSTDNFTPAQWAAAGGSFTHIYGDGVGDVSRTISLDLVDEDGSYLSVATQNITVKNVATPPAIIHLGNATGIVNGADPNGWATSWTDPDVAISHKADYVSNLELWSPVTLNALRAGALSGGDLYGGNLGVSGRNLATSGNRQEIQGAEALRFDLADPANKVTLNLSRFFQDDDRNLLNQNEAGRLQALDDAGNVVKELTFTAISHGRQNMTLTLTLDGDAVFSSLVLSAGAYDDQHQFVFGAYVNDGGATVDPYRDFAGRLHGSDFLVHDIEFEVPVLGGPVVP